MTYDDLVEELSGILYNDQYDIPAIARAMTDAKGNVLGIYDENSDAYDEMEWWSTIEAFATSSYDESE